MSISENCPKCGEKYTYHVEYSYDSIEHYDGVSEHYCKPCDLRIGRWTNQILKEGEVEPVYGRIKPFVPNKCKCENQKNPEYPTCFICFQSQKHA